MLAAKIYTARSAAGKSIDGNVRTDVVPSTIKPPREERTRKLATANAAVVSSLVMAAANPSVLPILLNRMIPQRRTPAMVNQMSQSAARPTMAGRRSILETLPQRQARAVNRINQPALSPRQREPVWTTPRRHHHAEDGCFWKGCS